MMKANEIASKAANLISGDRNDQYGEMEANHLAIACLWNGYLYAKRTNTNADWDDLSAADVARMMVLLKIARTLNGSFNADDYIDAAGYAAIAGDIEGRHILYGKPPVVP